MPTLLCIDDDEAFCEALELALRDSDLEIRTARTTGEGLRLLGSAELVLIDWNLRGVSGDQVIRALRELSTVPVILTSAAPPADGDAAARACGAQRFLAKPFELEELLRMIDEVLGSNRAVPTLSKSPS